MKFVLLIALCLCFGVSYAQSWEWLKPLTSDTITTTTDMISGNDSLIFVSGSAYDTFDYNGVSYNISPNINAQKDAWLICVDSDGATQWHTTISGSKEVVINKVSCRNGKIYVTGKYSGPYIVFSNNDSLTVTTSAENYTLFMACYNSSGQHLYSQYLATGLIFNVTDFITLDDFYVSGTFTKTFKVNTQLFNSDLPNFFVLKCDSMGNIIRFRNGPKATSVLMKASTNNDTIFCAIQYNDTCNLGINTYYNNGTSVCIVAIDTALTPLWSVPVTSNGAFLTDALFYKNQFCITGHITADTDFGNGFTIQGPYPSAFVATYGTTGQTKSLLRTTDCLASGRSITSDSSNNLYVSILTPNDSIVFNNDTTPLNSTGNNLSFITYKLSNDSILRYKRVFSTNSSSTYDVDINASATNLRGDFFCAGNFNCSMTSDSLSFNTNTFIPAAFMAKISCVPANPLISYSSLEFCPGDSVLLTTPPMDFYSPTWSNGSTNSQIYVTQPGLYQVFVSDENNCQSPPSAVQTVMFAQPQVNILKNCDTLSIQPQINATNLWNYHLDTLETNTPSIIVMNAGWYTIALTDSNGCMTSDSIFQYTKVNLTIEKQCDTLTINVPAGYNYNWLYASDTILSNFSQITVLNPGWYSTAVTDSNGCYVTDSIYQYTKVDLNIQRQCDSLQTNAPAGYNYYWFYNSDTIFSNLPQITILNAGWYTTALTDSNGCYVTDSLYQHAKVSLTMDRLCDTLTVNEPFGYNYNWIYASDTIFTNLSHITVINPGWYSTALTDSNGCYITDSIFQHTKVFLDIQRDCDTLSVVAPSGYNYYWYYNADTIFSNLGNITAQNPGWYATALTDSNGCYVTDSIYQHNKANFVISHLCDTISLNIDNGYNYHWVYETDTLHANLPQITIQNPGWYQLAFTDSNGCYISDSVYQFSHVAIDIQRQCDTLTTIVPAGYNYYWTHESDTLSSNAISFYPEFDGNFVLLLTDSNGCFVKSAYNYVETDKYFLIEKVCDSLYVADFSNANWYVNDYLMTIASYLNLGEINTSGTYFATRIDSVGCIATSDSLQIGKSTTNYPLNIYPNPVQDFLYIEISKDIPLNINISKSTGEKLSLEIKDFEILLPDKNEPCKSGIIKKTRISTAGLKPGIYILNVVADDMMWNRTFIKL